MCLAPLIATHDDPRFPLAVLIVLLTSRLLPSLTTRPLRTLIRHIFTYKLYVPRLKIHGILISLSLSRSPPCLLPYLLRLPSPLSLSSVPTPTPFRGKGVL